MEKNYKAIGRTLTLVGALSMGLFSAASHASAFTGAEEAVEYRQSGLQLMRENFATMAGMVRGEIDFDADMFEQRAHSFYHASYLPWDGFRYAGENVRGDGDALPAIWENWDDFEQRIAQLNEDAKALTEAAATGDMSTIRGAFMSTARNCQQCHDRYRD